MSPIHGKPVLNDAESQFLAGAVAEREPAPAPAPSVQQQLPAMDAVAGPQSMQVTVYKPEPVVQKMFRLPWSVATALKTAAAMESAQAGRTITETKIVEEVLRQRFKKAGIPC